MSRFMIDLDNVYSDFSTAMIPCLQQQGVITDADDYYFGVPKAEFRSRIRHAIRHQGLFERGEEYEGATEALWTLSSAGHDLVVVSARLYGKDTECWSYHQTLKWLQRHNAPPMEILLVEHGTNKADVCREFQLDIAIEDDLKNYDDLAQSLTTTVYLMDRQWNRGVDWVLPEYRVRNWAEFVERVK